MRKTTTIAALTVLSFCYSSIYGQQKDQEYLSELKTVVDSSKIELCGGLYGQMEDKCNGKRWNIALREATDTTGLPKNERISITFSAAISCKGEMGNIELVDTYYEDDFSDLSSTQAELFKRISKAATELDCEIRTANGKPVDVGIMLSRGYFHNGKLEIN